MRILMAMDCSVFNIGVNWFLFSNRQWHCLESGLDLPVRVFICVQCRKINCVKTKGILWAINTKLRGGIYVVAQAANM